MASGEESMKFLISGRIATELECPVCMIEKQLRILPCGHRFCKDCIVGLAVRKGLVPCPTCRSVATLPVQGFPVCPLSDYLQDQLRIAKKPAKSTPKICGTVCSCGKSVEARCQLCKRYICYRCAKRSQCSNSPNEHDAEDLDDLKLQLESKLNEWKIATENEIKDLQSLIKETEKKVSEKRSLLETSSVLEFEEDNAEKISWIEQILGASAGTTAAAKAVQEQKPSLPDSAECHKVPAGGKTKGRGMFLRLEEMKRRTIPTRLEELKVIDIAGDEKGKSDEFRLLWSPQYNPHHESVVPPNSQEFAKVSANYYSSASDMKIVEMRRVQNPLLYQQYIQLRETVARKYNKSVDDVETRPLWCFINKLDVESNTTWNYKQENGPFGIGSYFYRNIKSYVEPSPIHRFHHHPGSQGRRPPPPHHVRHRGRRNRPRGHLHRPHHPMHMPPPCRHSTPFVCSTCEQQSIVQVRVITGEWIQGCASMLAAPYNNPAEKYDTVVDDASNPSLFVVFNKIAAYPEYIIGSTSQTSYCL